MNDASSPKAFPATDSFCQQIINAAESHLDKLAMKVVGVEGTEYTYGEMLEAVWNIAYRLEKEGIQFGDRVALVGENHPRWAIAYFGILFRGAVCVPIDPHGEIETITNFFENSETKMAFIGADFIKHFREVEAKLERSIPVVVLQDLEEGDAEKNRSEPGAVATGLNAQDNQPQMNADERRLKDGSPAAENQKSKIKNQKSKAVFQAFDDWASTKRPADFNTKSTPAKPDDLAVLMYTSGTTGKPKGVPLTHGNIFYEANGCQEVMHIKETEVVLSVLPLFHVFAQVVNLWVIAIIGGTIYYVKELVPDELTRAFKTGEVTLLTGVPRIWYLFHKKVFDQVAAQSFVVRGLFDKMLKANFFLREKFNINLGRKLFGKVHEGFGGKLDVTISAGSRFDEKIARDYYALGFSMIQGYGLTETCGAVTATRFEDNVVGSVGKAVNYAEIKLGELNDEGAGEVLIKGKMVFSGYYKNPEATAEAFTEDGWFRSGDLGKINQDGHLFIVGRSKDVIVLPSGKNIHPEDLEVHYAKLPLVEEICILGVKDESSSLAGAEKLIALVVPDFAYLKQNNIANSREAIRHELDDLGRQLPEYQRVRDYVIRSEPLPRTATRKIKRFELQKEIEQNGYDTKAAPDKKQWNFSDENRALLESNVGQTVAKVIKQNSRDAENIHPEMNLEIDLGLDSLSRAEVFAALEQAFNVEFDSEKAANALTVGEVVKLAENTAGGADAAIVETDFNWGKIVREADDQSEEVQNILRPRTVFPWLVFVVFRAFRGLCKIFLKLEVSGAEELDKLKRPYIVCPNHQSFIDPVLVSSNYSYETIKNTFAVGASEFFQSSFMKFLARMMNTIPINPDMQLTKAMRASATGLKHGKVLNIFPEGERGFDGELHEFKKGAAILATELNIPIIPVALDGLHKVWGRSSKQIKLSKVKMKFGKPFYAKEVTQPEMDAEEKYRTVTEHLKSEIEAMLEEMRK